MRILILGASGRTGKWVLREALERSYEVNCLVRDAAKLKEFRSANVFEGNPGNPSDLARALEDCDAVISVLNISRTSDFPWSPLRTPKNYLSVVMTNLLRLMESEGPKRISLCSAWGVAETRKDIPFWFRWMIDYSNIGAAYRDHERQEAVLAQSNLKWTVVRPVGLTNSKGNEAIGVSLNNEPKPKLLVSRRSVAEFLLRTLEDDTWIGQKIAVFKK